MLVDVDYDIVSGPVANDNTMSVLNLYFKGAYSEEEALRRLLPQRLKGQFALKTDAALSCLTFLEGRDCMSGVPVDMLDYYDEEVVRRIIEKYGYGEREALGQFLESQTYGMLANPAMEMWQFGPEGIFNIWESEKVTGSPKNSAYLRME